MALTTTTLAAAVGINDASVTVTSATGFAAGYMLRVDQEVMKVAQNYSTGTTIPVLRGVNGSASAAHASGANITSLLASDETYLQSPQTTGPQWPAAGWARTVASYSATGAIALPAPGTDAIAILNGTNAILMTLANPTKDMDGSLLYIMGNGKAAHTVTYTAGFGNAGASYDVATYTTGGQNGTLIMAVNGIWVSLSSFTGTLTAIVPAIA